MTDVKISGNRLLLARKRRMLTQTALAQSTELPQTLISRLENAVTTDITDEQLHKLSDVLEFPTSWFTKMSGTAVGHPLSLHSVAFRKAASPSQKKVDFVIALANQYALQVAQLLDAVELESSLELPAFEVIAADDGQVAHHANAVGTPEEAAQRLRQIWRLGRGPIQNLVGLIEACGIIVVHADFEEVDADGLTLRLPGCKPIIFLNRDRPGCRQRFSLAHELGHVVLHAFHSPDMELEANRFAAEFLMPEADIKSDLGGRISIARLGQLKIKWRVSMGALLYRSQELRLQSPHITKRLWIQMSQAGYRVREPEEFAVDAEAPSVFSRLVELHLHELGYSADDLASLLDTNPSEFRQMAGLSQSPQLKLKAAKLRVVVDNSKAS